MGVKGVAIASTLSVAAVVLNGIGAASPMHILSFFTFVGTRIFAGKTYLLWWKVADYSTDFCRMVPDSVCNDIHDVHSLQDIAQRFCSPAAKTLFPSVCIGLDRAYIGGMILFVMCILNGILLLVGNFLLWDYILRSKKQKYRANAMTVMSVAALIQVASLTGYGAFVLLPLDQSASSHPLLNAIVAASHSTGVSSGVFLMGTSTLIQGVTLFIVTYAKSSSELDEGDIEDRKEMAALMAEQQKMLAEAGYGAMAPSGYGAMPPAGYGAMSPAGYGPMPQAQAQGPAMPPLPASGAMGPAGPAF